MGRVRCRADERARGDEGAIGERDILEDLAVKSDFKGDVRGAAQRVM